MGEKFVSNNYKPATLPEVLLELHEAVVKSKSEPASREAALAIIKEYFHFFGRMGMRQDMWLLITGALSNGEISRLNEGIERYNLFFFYEFTLMLIDAVYVIHEQET